PAAETRVRADRDNRRAASPGSARWCFGACCSRRRGVLVGLHPGTGSSSHSWVKGSREASVVLLAGGLASPVVVASQGGEDDVGVDAAGLGAARPRRRTGGQRAG